jgi:protein TonB
MFEQIRMAEAEKRYQPLSFAASLTAQTIVAGIALALPLMHVARIEARLPDNILFLPKQLGSVDPVRTAVTRQITTSNLSGNSQLVHSYLAFQWPSKIPARVATGPDVDGAPVFAIGAPGFGDPNGVPTGMPVEIANQRIVQVAPPEPPHHAAAQQAAALPRIRVGGGVQAAKLIFGPKPVYPPMAKAARISGSVHLSALISADGRIRGLQLVSGHPLLTQAAFNAVKQWVYQPTLLNGEPVEVLTEIDVNFVLNQ